MTVFTDESRRRFAEGWPKVLLTTISILDGHEIEATVLDGPMREGATVRFRFENGIRDYEVVQLDGHYDRAYLRRIDAKG